MILWTIQHVDAWKKLQRDGVLRGDMRRVCHDWRPAYRWLMDAVGYERVPIWAWHSRDGRRKKPDLRCSFHMPQGERGVCIEADVPDHLVTLSRFELWHLVLNDSHLSENEEHDIENPTLAQMKESWRYIFDLNFGDPEWLGNPAEDSIQATVPFLRLEWVLSHRHFRGR